MDVQISKLGVSLFRNVSPVREIMNFADPKKLREFGINPEELISFGGGWVNHKSPKLLQEIYKNIINDDEKFHFSGGYSPTNGEKVFKEAVVKFESHLFNMSGLTAENILTGQSSTELTYLLFSVLLDDNDKICILDPSYCNYPLQITTGSKATIIRFPVIDEETYEYIANEPSTIATFRKFLLKEKPKVILLVSPDNPTSQILSDDFIKSTHEIVKSYGGIIVIDFAYKTLVFDKIPEYFSWAPDGNFMSIHSNSKWCRGLGRRLGWLEAPKNIIESFESFQNTTILSPDRLHQMAFAEYVESSIAEDSLMPYFVSTKELYRKTAEFTSKSINDFIGLPHFNPAGGLYSCIRIFNESAKFVEDLLKSTGVLFVPGWGFGRTLRKSVRISYGPLVNNHELIAEGLKKAGSFIRNYKI